MIDVKELRRLVTIVEDRRQYHEDWCTAQAAINSDNMLQLLDALEEANDLIERQASRLDEVHDMLGDEQALKDSLDFISKQNAANYEKLQVQIAEISQMRTALERLEGYQGIKKSALIDKILELDKALEAADELAEASEYIKHAGTPRFLEAHNAYRAAREGK